MGMSQISNSSSIKSLPIIGRKRKAESITDTLHSQREYIGHKTKSELASEEDRKVMKQCDGKKPNVNSALPSVL